ncbi:hypothetical protein E9993_06505 [Labilibacter sediminis]|nr:hypothetical protein E9993_06505 [Labilibacter sediminis]
MKVYVILFLLVCGIVACNDDDKDPVSYDPIPDELVGTWTYTDMDDGAVENLVFQKVSEKAGLMEWYMNMHIVPGKPHLKGEYVNVMAAKAEFVIQGTLIIPSITHWGSQLIEFEDDVILDEIRWYTMDDDEWDWFETEPDMSFHFELGEDEFIMLVDMDGDGRFDEDEKTIYTRVL